MKSNINSIDKIHNYICNCLNNGNKIQINIEGINEYNTEFRQLVNPTDIKVGDELYIDTSDLVNIEKSNYTKIRVTYIRAGVIFYVKIKNPKKEYWISQHSMYFYAGRIFPTKVEIDSKKYPKKYYEFVCKCPYVKIIYK